ncbi:MAG: hypothetical protein KBG21_10080, partial [Ignavibacteria bacterium]|nr:hypothetical protein [Ignavibacteria bacterium]
LIVFGEEEIDLMKEIPDIAYRIILTAQTTLACADYDIELMESNEKILWCHDENDETNLKLNNILSKIEKKCYPAIRKK